MSNFLLENRFIHQRILTDEVSQLALPASPLLKMKSVTGVKNSNVHKVSIKLTEIQKAVMTLRIMAMLPIMNIPQKSICLMFAFKEL